MNKPGPRVIFKRVYKKFNQEKFVKDVKNLNWSNVLSKKNQVEALLKFGELKISSTEEVYC